MLYKNSIYSLASRVAMGGGKTIFILGIAKFFKLEDIGLFSISLIIVTTLSLIFSMGVEVANAYLAKEDNDSIPFLFAHSFLLSTVSIIPAWVFVRIGFYIFEDTIFKGFDISVQPILVILVAMQILQILLQGIITGIARFKIIFISTIIQYGFYLAAFFFYLLKHPDFYSLIKIWLLGIFISNFYLTGIMMRFLKKIEGFSLNLFSLDLFYQQISFGLKTIIGTFANILNFRMDTFLIAFFLDSSYVAWYSMSATIAESALYFHKGLGSVMLAINSTEQSNDKNADKEAIFLLKTGIALGVLVGLFCIFITYLLVNFILGELYQSILIPTQILISATYIFGVGIIASNYLYARGMPFYPTKAALIAGLITILGDLVLIPKAGIIGAALVSLIAYGCYGLLLLHWMKNALRLRLSTQSFLFLTNSELSSLLNKVHKKNK